MLKDQIINDIQGVFLDSDEFGDTHNIDGTDKTVIVDDDLLEQKKMQHDLYQAELLFHIASSDIDKPEPGQSMLFDDKSYRVLSAIENDGMYTVTLHRNAY